ncbi:MAG: hypothetical protein KTR20_03915 [Cellvibrionaceae bacterium]|nr:hypothetical protein [Cellvibrionaceae bacterium]
MKIAPYQMCSLHSNALSRQPLMVNHYYELGFDTGIVFFDQQLWEEAIAYFSIAFEASEIMMTMKVFNSTTCYDAFAEITRYLADAFSSSEKMDQSLNVLKLAIYRFEQEALSAPEKKASVRPHLNSLYRQLEISTCLLH